MKRTDLKVGVVYSDGKKSLRRILAFGPEYKVYNSQTELDCLKYAVVKGSRGGHDFGKTQAGEQIRYSTAMSFAAWAKSEVEASDNDQP